MTNPKPMQVSSRAIDAEGVEHGISLYLEAWPASPHVVYVEARTFGPDPRCGLTLGTARSLRDWLDAVIAAAEPQEPSP
jgi:hypothetical protein